MRVLLVNKFVRVTGGADRHCLELARALRAAGHEVAFLSTADRDRGERDGIFVPAAVTAERRAELGPRAAAHAAAWAMWNPTAAAATRRLLTGFRPDVVHVHKLYPQLSVAPVVVSARRGVPVVQTVHDYELAGRDPYDDGSALRPSPARPLADRTLSAALRPVHRRWHRPAVRAWVAASQHVADVHARLGIHATVLPLPTSAPPGRDPAWPQRSGIVYVGRIAAEKGVLDLVDLARRVPEIRVAAVGGGPLEPVLRRSAGGVRNLELTGPVSPDEVWRRLRAARVAVLPSRWAEPAGLAALEAMAVGTPVVAHAVGGLAEEVRGAEGGVLVPADPASLAEACRALHADEARWRRLSAAGRRHVVCEHDPGRYAERMVAVYAAAGA